MMWSPMPSPTLLILVMQSPISLMMFTFFTIISFWMKSTRWKSFFSVATVCRSCRVRITVFSISSTAVMASMGVPHSILVGLVMSCSTTLPPTLGLVLHQGIPMLQHCNGRLLEEACKARKCLVNPVEVVGHSNVDIACIELHVDMLVDQSLALLMVVLADLLGHLDRRGGGGLRSWSGQWDWLQGSPH